ncbi:hypothetical protein [Mumia zhuanghuii]|uniref:Uncharacterized protein n=1 Tax=Mumia zhuanghuii TaxID=2585211 RepID=A0A5C4M9G6_9ACTN|nr:hypothetical protein [Mumia zhuanghuii]TNC31283.1 hypothetical protein FHE65_31920 [Mumia zhuanghuii]
MAVGHAVAEQLEGRPDELQRPLSGALRRRALERLLRLDHRSSTLGNHCDARRGPKWLLAQLQKTRAPDLRQRLLRAWLAELLLRLYWRHTHGDLLRQRRHDLPA